MKNVGANIESHTGIISNGEQIVKIIMEHCILKDSVEVFIKKTPRFFTSNIIDSSPDIQQKALISFDVLKGNHPSSPFSYLKKKKYLLMRCSVLSQEIKEGSDVTIRFFTGTVAMMTDIPLKRFIAMRNEQVMVMGFPSHLETVDARSEFRIQALPDSKVTVTVNSDSIHKFNARIYNVSVGGVSFLSTSPPEPLSVGKKIHLLISSPDGGHISLDGVICHYRELSDNKYCGPGEAALYGITFSRPSEEQKAQIVELIAHIHQESLVKEREDLLTRNRALEKKALEQTELLRQRDLRVLELNRIVGIATLTADIADDIDTPLSVVKNSLELLRSRFGKLIKAVRYLEEIPLPSHLLREYRDYLSEINIDHLTTSHDERFDRLTKGIERAITLVKSLKSLSRIDHEKIGKTDINQSINNSIDLLRSYKGVEVKFITTLGNIPLLKCSPHKISHCILHTVKNAMDAVDRNGVIEVMTSHDKKKNQITIQISDNGKGVPLQGPRGPGLGSGRSLTEEIVSWHGGSVTLSAEKGQGTRVTMILPVGKT